MQQLACCARTVLRTLMSATVLLSSATFDCAAQSAAAERDAWTVTLENDIPTGSDNNYTNGLGLSWVSKPVDSYEERSLVRRWSSLWSGLPFVGNDGYRTYAAW